MCGPYFNLKAAKAPAISGYDVHIYTADGWDAMIAHTLAEELVKAFPHDIRLTQGVAAGTGPHTLANIEIDIKPQSFGKVLAWLQMNSNGLSILVHPHTGDEMRDHTDLANWIGTPVPLNLATLGPLPKTIKSKPPTL